MKLILIMGNLAVMLILVGLFFVLDQLRTDVILAFLAGQVLWNIAYRLQSGHWFEVEPVHDEYSFANLIDREPSEDRTAAQQGKTPQAQ